MKKSIWFLVVTFSILFCCPIAAQQLESLGYNSQAINYEHQAEKAFGVIPALLDSKVQGIVESAIYTAIEVRKYYPSADYTDMIGKLNRIAEANPDPSTRAKAYLAGICLSSSDIMEVEPDHGSYEHDYIYKQITEQLENQVLAHK
jgi:hypothetical protein